MRHPIEGTPYVPPTCPVSQSGDIPNLGSVPFRLIMDPGHNRPTQIYGSFEVLQPGEGGQDDMYIAAHVSTDALEMPPENPLEQRVRQLMGVDPGSFASGSRKHTERLVVNMMRMAFCERVADCRGIVDGECWALGAKAVQEVVGEILNVRTDTPRPTSGDNQGRN